MEKEIFDQRNVQETFFEHSDVIRTDTGERALSLKKFVSIVVEKNLFSKEKQAQFAFNFKPDAEVLKNFIFREIKLTSFFKPAI